MNHRRQVFLHRDDDWLVVDKPTGLATHAGQPGELGATEWLALHLDLTTYVVSRLDRGTSGALLLARNPAASARAQRVHEAEGARKIYEFWSHADSLATGGGGATWTRTDPLDDKPARTTFTRLGPAPHRGGEGPIRYRAEIRRGRRHQIRRHAATSGVPILGDTEYGGAPGARLYLHCHELHWPEIARPVRAPLPPAFDALASGTAAEIAPAVCLERRGAWPALVSDAWRAVHRDEIPDLPAAIEIYGPWFSVLWYDEATAPPAAEERLRPVLEQVAAAYGCRGGVIRGHRQNPHRESLIGFSREVGEPPPPVFTVSEHDLRYEIRLTATQHTGLFLDQRDTRRRVARAAAGRRIANLFAYTCSFAVVAAAHEAEVVFSVDTAKAGLRAGMANFARNRLTATGRGKFIQQDARKWLRRQLRLQTERPAEFCPLGLMICDPPVFAGGSRGESFVLSEEWPDLAAGASRLLSGDGLAVFANNHRHGDHAFYRRTLDEHFTRVTDLRPPLDFPLLTGRHHHVRTFWCEK